MDVHHLSLSAPDSDLLPAVAILAAAEAERRGGTGSMPTHLALDGLGRWMKAEMFRWATAELPPITEVRTENAHSSPHMLAINDALGFVPFAEETTYQRRLG